MVDPRHEGPPDDDLVLAELRSIAARTEPDQVTWEAPPADLWDRIAAEVATDGPTDHPGDAPPAAGASTPDDLRARRSAKEQRRGRTWAPWLAGAAAAAIVVVAVALGVLVQRDGDGPEVLAVTELDVLGDGGSGTAELIDDHGHRRLRVTTSGLDAGDGFLEVWMIDEAVTKLVSLGPLRADGVYDLPDGLDPGDFPVIDISVEPFNGDPTHSGNSVLRGQLSV